MSCSFVCWTILSGVLARSPAFLGEPGSESALDAAASEAGSAAGKEVILLVDRLLRSPIPTTNVTADTSVAAPSPFPATAPSHNASQEVCPRTSMLSYADNVRHKACVGYLRSSADRSLLFMHREFPFFQLGAFLLDHAARIAPLEGANGSHLIQAVMLAQPQLQADVRPSLALLASSASCLREQHMLLATS